MIQKIKVVVKKVKNVGFVMDNNTIYCKYNQFRRGAKMVISTQIPHNAQAIAVLAVVLWERCHRNTSRYPSWMHTGRLLRIAFL
jgi:hypothetical protein